MEPMLLIELKQMGDQEGVLALPVGGDCGDELAVAETAVRVILAMRKAGFALDQILVIDTAARVPA